MIGSTGQIHEFEVMTAKKPSVFISYAHKDGMEFTRRLAFALSMYMDVFWDRRLQAGPYPPQLLKEIEQRLVPSGRETCL